MAGNSNAEPLGLDLDPISGPLESNIKHLSGQLLLPFGCRTQDRKWLLASCNFKQNLRNQVNNILNYSNCFKWSLKEVLVLKDN